MDPHRAERRGSVGRARTSLALEDTSDAHLSGTTANATPATPETLGLAVYVDDLAQKAGNARRSLEEGQVRLVRGVFRVKWVTVEH
jgi:hypothetical protein